MLFNIEPQKGAVTAPAVTITLDPETCFTLAQVFQELGAALTRAERAYNTQKRWKADEPKRIAKRNELQAAIALKMEELKELPYRKIISTVGKSFGIGWDMASFLCADVRREKRQAALASRNDEVMRLAEEGLTMKAIAERSGLSVGTVKNIAHKRRRAALRPVASRPKAV